MTSDAADAQLKKWYLARLRKSVIVERESTNLTPMTLIECDAEFVERLIEEHHKEQAKTEKREPDSARVPKSLEEHLAATVLAPALIFAALACIASVVLLSNIHSSAGVPIEYQLAILCMISIPAGLSWLLVWNFVQNHVTRPLNKTLEITASKIADAGARLVDSNNTIERLRSATECLALDCERSLRREEAIAEYTSQIYFSLNPFSVFCASSRSSAKYFGVNPEAESRLFTDFIAKEQLPNFLTLMKAVKVEQGQEITLKVICSDQSIAYLRLSMEWSEADQKYFCVGTDVTEQHTLEQLRVQFVDMITHDMKVPLSNILVGAQSLQAELLGPQTAESSQQLRSIAKSSQTLLSLIKDLLDLEKTESGLVQLNKRMVDINELMAEAIETVGLLADAKEISIENESIDQNYSVELDPERMEQVLVNLLSNAIKFSPNSSIIRVRAIENSGNIVIEIADEGRGINPRRPGQSFRQIHATTGVRQYALRGLRTWSGYLQEYY